MASVGTDKIIQEIVRLGDAPADQILQDARRTAAGIREDAEKKARLEREAILTRGQQVADREHQRILADAKIRVRRKISDMKEEQIKKAFSEAERRLIGLAGKSEYSNILNKLIVESGIVAGGGPLEVQVRVHDRPLLSEETLAHLSKKISKIAKKPTSLKLSKDPLAAIGGAIVRSEGGVIEVDNTFDSRLERLKRELRFKVAEILFGGTS
jgi:V/A-type H+-transporting ATPase subunit E